ncbi:MAG: YggT family protein [Deltaproteobacteria bacterium]|jgi:YggT family protein|nr:YggT family protein [Deltaproteobacteria bacterium]
MITTMSYLLYLVITIYGWIVLLRVLVSWFAPSPRSPFMLLLRRLTEPALRLARRLFPVTLGGLDFSPVVLLVFLYFLGNFVLLGGRALGEGASLMALLPVFVFCLVELVKSLTVLLLILMAARAVLSLVKPDPYNPLALIVYGSTEPLLAPFRNWFPRGPWGLDLRAVLFIVFLLLFYALILQNLQLMTVVWARRYGLGAGY